MRTISSEKEVEVRRISITDIGIESYSSRLMRGGSAGEHQGVKSKSDNRSRYDS